MSRHSYDENGICRCGASRFYSSNLEESCPIMAAMPDELATLRAEVQRLTEALQTALALLPEIEASLSNDALADMNFFEVWAALRTAGEGK
jgi:hypothetical protein